MPEATVDAGTWSAFASRRPRLRPEVRAVRQHYRGERWYVLHDEATGRYLRVNASAYAVVGRLDGRNTVADVADAARAALGADAPSASEVIGLLLQLHAAGLLRGELPDRSGGRSLLPRAEGGALPNPLALRFRLFNPDALLAVLTPLARGLFSSAGACLWLVLMVAALAVAIGDSTRLLQDLQRTVTRPDALLLIAVAYPCIKLLHELAHGVAIKVWGGVVPACGITLLVLMPVPWVDASAAWAFPDRRKRAIVGAAGIGAELALAALGILVWGTVEPGVVSAAALVVTTVGGVSTLLFNGNPLLRYDGYYVLEDLIEVPNLATRSGRYWLYLLRRYLLGMRDAGRPAVAPGERGWLTVYGALAPPYRIASLFLIAIWLAQHLMALGVALAVYVVFQQGLLPVARGLAWISTCAALAGRRMRAIAGVFVPAVAVGAGIACVPLPLVTSVQGVVWVPDQAQLYAGTDGFVDAVLVAPGSHVPAGAPVLRLADPDLMARLAIVQARIAELDAETAAVLHSDRTRAQALAADGRTARAEYDRLRERASRLLVRSPVAGVFLPPAGLDLEGRYLRQGDIAGYLVAPGRLVVRAVVPQQSVGLLDLARAQASVRFAEDPRRVHRGQVVREVPAATARLPSPALGAQGGGTLALEAGDATGVRVSESVFEVEIGLPADVATRGIGGRAYVRLEHGREPLLGQWGRTLRQLVLRRLGV